MVGVLIAGGVRRTGMIRWRPEGITLLCLAVMKLCGCPQCVDRFDGLVPAWMDDGATKKWSHPVDVGTLGERVEPEPTSEELAAIVSDTTKNVQ